MTNNKNETTLIQIIPESVNLKKYYPEKINEQIITIRNNCNIPLILFLTSSDSNILILKESSIKIGKNQKKTFSFIIKDNNYKKNQKFFTKPKKLYIFLKNDLIEEKIEVILSYYYYENSAFSENKIPKNRGYLSFNSHNKSKLNSNKKKTKKIMPTNLDKLNLNKEIKTNNIMPERQNNLVNDDKKMDENDYLNTAVLDLRNQISYLKQTLEQSQMKIQKLQIQKKKNFSGNLMRDKCISFFIFGDDYEIFNQKNERVQSKKELYEYQNIKLKNENQKLNRMVQFLEDKLLTYENDFPYQSNNFNKNNNYIFSNHNYI